MSLLTRNPAGQNPNKRENNTNNQYEEMSVLKIEEKGKLNAWREA